MKQHSHIITESETGIRLDKIMTEVIADQSRQKLQQWIKDGYITVNQQICKPNYNCAEADVIEWSIPEAPVIEIPPEDLPLDILYEDNSLLVINKPKGMLVHPTNKVHTDTLVNALKYHCAELSDLSGSERPGIVHRLDQDTSGLLLVAKNNQVHEKLKEQFQQHSVERVYETVVIGVVQHDKGVIKAPIGRNPKNRLQMAVVPNGKPAETHFKVLQRFREYTHLECELVTGRTHQIRVHLKYLNHPVVGDPLYVRKKSSLMNSQALFAKKLSFYHPELQKQMTFEIPAPEDFKQLLTRLQTAQ